MALIQSLSRAMVAGATLGTLWTGPGLMANDRLVDQWLEAQREIQTMEGEFVQTRTLKSLTRPLKVNGKVWFEHPNQFRWELGDPAHTVAIREPEQVTVIYPRLKRAEQFELTGNSAGPWRDALALFEAGFPRSRQQLEEKFSILNVEETPDRVTVQMAPKSSSARRFMPRVEVTFHPSTHKLLATELQFSDDSSLRNEFTKLDINSPLADGLFEPQIDPSYKISRPAEASH